LYVMGTAKLSTRITTSSSTHSSTRNCSMGVWGQAYLQQSTAADEHTNE
jgi:hypothetical protein